MQIEKLIGRGATAEVFDYDENRVIKLYHAGESESSLKWEYDKMKYANENHVPCPKVYDLIKIDGRHGYIMEKYNGITYKEKLLSDIQSVISNGMSMEDFTVNFFDDIKGVARALFKLHKVKIPGWVKINDTLLWEVQSTEFLLSEEKNRIVDLIEKLPNDSAVCHGDPNPNNIMYYEGEFKLIDWVNAGIGNPLYDIAEYIWLNTPKEEANFEGVPQELIDFYLHNKDLIIPTFLNEYERLSGTNISSSYEPFMIPLLVRKLHSNRTNDEKTNIVLEIRDRLSNLI